MVIVKRCALPIAGTSAREPAFADLPGPQEVAVEVPAIRPYKYMVVNARVVLTDPATSEVVAEVAV